MTGKTTGKTQEVLTSELMNGIDGELDHYGAVSLADFCASVIDGRCDDERDDYAYWSDVRKAFNALSDQLEAINRKHKFTPPQRGSVPPAADSDNPNNDGAGEEQ